MNGTKYFAVETAPIEIRPAVFPAIISSEVSQSAIAASIRSESASTSRPASVKSMPSLVRWIRGRPASACKLRICRVTAGWVRWSRLAAAVTDRSR